jgi:hypothetical protein
MRTKTKTRTRTSDHAEGNLRIHMFYCKRYGWIMLCVLNRLMGKTGSLWFGSQGSGVPSNCFWHRFLLVSQAPICRRQAVGYKVVWDSCGI